jgi:hypothetical protein
MTTPSPLLATLDELAKRADLTYERDTDAAKADRLYRDALMAAYPRLRAIIAAADELREKADTYLAWAGDFGDEELAAAITAFDAARGEKTT